MRNARHPHCPGGGQGVGVHSSRFLFSGIFFEPHETSRITRLLVNTGWSLFFPTHPHTMDEGRTQVNERVREWMRETNRSHAVHTFMLCYRWLFFSWCTHTLQREWVRETDDEASLDPPHAGSPDITHHHHQCEYVSLSYASWREWRRDWRRNRGRRREGGTDEQEAPLDPSHVEEIMHRLYASLGPLTGLSHAPSRGLLAPGKDTG